MKTIRIAFNLFLSGLLAIVLTGCLSYGVADDTHTELGGQNSSASAGASEADNDATANPPSISSGVSVSSIALSRDALTLAPGQSGKLSLSVTLSNGVTYQRVAKTLKTAYGLSALAQWFSNNEDVVTVTEDGKLTAIGPGQTTVKASVSNKSVLAAITVVAEEPDTLTALRFTQTYSQTSQAKALSLTLSATFEEDGIFTNLRPSQLAALADCDVSLASSRPDVGTLDDDGTFTPLANGETRLSAACGDLTAEMDLAVKGMAVTASEDGDDPQPIDSDNALVLRTDGGEITVGESDGLECDLVLDGTAIDGVSSSFVTPAGETAELVWQSSDESVATVTDGFVEFLNYGTVTITASYGTLSDSVEFSVKMAPEDLDDTARFLGENDTLTLTVGEDGGFGESNFPDVAYDAPVSSRTDVVSLGRGGEVLIELGDRVIVDGPGADFTVFENAFTGWVEPAYVAVSADGRDYVTFACDPSDEAAVYAGCAGITPVAYTTDSSAYWNPSLSGGDSFDLDDAGLSEIRYIRITDGDTCDDEGLCSSGTAGFDLDALAIVNGAE